MCHQSSRGAHEGGCNRITRHEIEITRRAQGVRPPAIRTIRLTTPPVAARIRMARLRIREEHAQAVTREPTVLLVLQGAVVDDCAHFPSDCNSYLIHGWRESNVYLDTK